MMVSFCAVLFPARCLDEILNLIESVSEGFPSYSSIYFGPYTFVSLSLKFPVYLSLHKYIYLKH